MKDCTFDFHIHTDIIGCANETMRIRNIIDNCTETGCSAIAITDHLDTPDQLKAHRQIHEQILSVESEIDIYFGAELDYSDCDVDFFYNEEIRDKYEFQFVIGGIHSTFTETYDLGKIIDIQHRHHIRTCMNPLVDVLVHPYWFSIPAFTRKGFPPFCSMKDVPASYARQLGQTAKETATAIEINSHSMLDPSYISEDFVKEYIDYLAIIADTGATFSVGSDAHDINHLAGIADAWAVAEKLGLSADCIYRPKCKPLKCGVKPSE